MSKGEILDQVGVLVWMIIVFSMPIILSLVL